MSSSQLHNSDEADALLADLVAEVNDKLQAGEPVDLEAYAARAPGGAEELRGLLPALAMLIAVGSTPETDDPSEGVKGEQAPPRELGDFRIVREVGRGGMGVVYEAEQRSLRRRVALKMLPLAAALDPRQLRRFHTEAQAAACLHHTSIVPVYYVGCERGIHFYTMQFIDGQSLAAVVKELRRQAGMEEAVAEREAPAAGSLAEADRTTAYTPAVTGGTPAAETVVQPAAALSTERSAHGTGYFRTVARLGVQAAEALEYAHQQGVIHRDVKPANLLVDVCGDLWVTDFGLARLQAEAGLTMTGDLVGTLRYMSPEQALAQRVVVDHRTDVYSLGATLYELLTLQPAFTGGDRQELLRQIAFEEPRPPRRLNKGVPAELETIVLKALEKNPADRYGTAQELADDLRRFLEDRPIRARRPTLGRRLRKWGRRHQGVVGTAVAALVLIAVGSVLAAVFFQRQEAEQRRLAKDAETQRQLAEKNAGEAQRQTGEAQRATEEANRQRNAVYQNLYYADMRLGLVDWNAGNVARLSHKLRSYLPQPGRADVRAWEWYYLLSLCHQDERTLLDHREEVSSISWSPNGRYLASASVHDTIRVWDTTSWRLLWTQRGAGAVAWSPDSQRLAWGGLGASPVSVWQVATNEIKALRGHTSSVWTVAWSPDGKRLASAGHERVIHIWEPVSRSCVRVLKRELPGIVSSVAWSPDGKQLAAAIPWNDKCGLEVWDAASGKFLQGIRYPAPEQGWSVAWSPDGNYLALGGHGKCIVYRTADWSTSAQWVGHNNAVLGVAWSPDGKQFATAGGDCLIKLWDPATGTCTLTLRGHLGGVRSVAWEPNGRRLASAGQDGNVKIWPVPLAPQPRRLDHRPSRIDAISWGEEPNTLRALDAASGSLSLWDVTTGERLRQPDRLRPTPLSPETTFGRFSSEGRLVALGTTDDGGRPELLICDARSGKMVQQVRAVPRPHGPCSFSPDESQLAVTSGNRVEIVDLRQDVVRFRQAVGVTQYGTTMSWSPDGRRLAGAGHNGYVHVIDVGKGHRILKLRHGSVSGVDATVVAWSPNGQRLVSGDHTGLAEVWEVPSGRKVASAYLHTATLHVVAWSPDGRRVASGAGDRTVRIWDPNRGEELLRFDTPEGAVTQLLWSRDGRRLAAACEEGLIHIWDASAGYNYVGGEADYTEQVRGDLKQAAELQAAGRGEEALALYEQTFQTSKAKLGPDHPETLASMTELAEAYRGAGRVPEGLALHEQTLEKTKVTLGPDHSDTLTTMDRLAEAYRGAGRLQEALALQEQALQKVKIKFGPDHPDALQGMYLLASAYQGAGKLQQADLLWRDLLHRRRKSDGPKSAATAGVLASLGLNLLKQQRYAEAEPLLRECLAIRVQKLPDTWLRFNTLSLLGGALLGQQKYAAAEPLLLQGYEGMKGREAQIPEPGKMRLPEAVERLVQLYEATNQPEKARLWREQAKPKPPDAASADVK
jgi:WD40 repeat protein/serine/threonine protein kinase